jgi:ferritin-like metal-binding protein YciE
MEVRMAIESLEELMLEELREIYSAERLALRAYPRLRKAIKTQSLREAVERHTEQTKEQIERLGQVFETMEAKTRGKTCHAMQGLIEEAQEHMEADLSPELLEVMLVADLQKVEHFEIAAYGSAKAHAEALGMDEAAQLLGETLNEEKETDTLLNQIAMEEVNPQAVGEMEGDAEGVEDEQEDEQQDEAPRKRSAASKSRGGSSKSENGESSRASGGEDDLKSREYRDPQGNVHHHTRSSGAQARK